MTQKIWIFTLALATLLAFPIASNAEEASEPLEVTAEEALEWDRDGQKFIARKDARAVQGDVTINANTLTAHYEDTKTNNFDIQKMIADKDVSISSRNNTAYGDFATYDIPAGVATMIGQNLRLISPDQTITARDKFTYKVADGKLEAHGAAKVVRAENTLEADLLIAYLRENALGERVLDRMEAKGNVVITTPTERATGRYSVYNANTNKAVLLGGVTITRGPNVLQGKSAEVDLTTNRSRIIGGTQETGGRVRGVFYPDSEKNNQE